MTPLFPTRRSSGLAGRGQVDADVVAGWLGEAGGSNAKLQQARGANTALEVLQIAQATGLQLGDLVARRAADAAASLVAPAAIAIDVVAVDRAGAIVGRYGRDHHG